MMIKLTEAERYLKDLYLSIVEEELSKIKSDAQIDTENPLCLGDDCLKENEDER